MANISIIGTGFVADLYMRSLETFPDIKVKKVYDRDSARLAAFSKFWGVTTAESIDDLLATSGNPDEIPDLVLNLTNPGSHYEVSRQCLEAGRHVYSEKPLATTMEHAYELHTIAKKNNLMLTSAPCSYLSEVAQTLWLAIREQRVGKPLLVYAELDDDFISQAPYQKWFSESGAPWPYRDEFLVGCTLEHAGYYLSWLMMIFGSVEKVIAASAELVKDKLANGDKTAPDYSTATLFFKSGMVARLTCGIIAPHNHGLRIFGDQGILEVNESWNNSASVKLRKRYVLRRRLINGIFARKIKLSGQTHPKVPRRGAAAMNFALGPAEVLAAIQEGRDPRTTADFALHLNEVTLAIQNSLDTAGVQIMLTSCPEQLPMPWANQDKQ
ncbi:MAG: Gfo/Idh/MocA family oxidoreductase [Methyloglobulus sp.]|nr:Gfo/Idh/MocA family oxidoreductase [Methyloglobulus sp.]